MINGKSIRKSLLAELLVAKSVVEESQIKKTFDEITNKSERIFARTLINRGIVSSEELCKLLSEHLGIPYIDLKEIKIDDQVPHLLSEDLLRRHTIVPIALEDHELSLAMSPPVDLYLLDEIELTTGYKVKPFIASEKDILFALNQHFSAKQRTKQTIIDMHIEEKLPLTGGDKLVIEEILETIESPPIVRLVIDIIDGAINERASDIHLEPMENDMRVRYRIDGLLHDIMNIPRNIELAVVSRVKILANMDITEKRQSQDGHMNIKKGDRDYDIRVSTFATINGEKVVMRLLCKDTMLIDMEELGLDKSDLEFLKQLTSRPYGMVLVTGPTGCGKTTTLYAVLGRLNYNEENIITIEEPVEYRLPGLNQAQVNYTAGITFATGLRSILRQDPNIIMVGEIRDPDTATIAVQAALTGHLVFSTLHTNDAASTVVRLLDMGIHPYLVASSIIGVVAQRLVRKICRDCRESYQIHREEIITELGEIRKTLPDYLILYKGRGCKLCNHLGYSGRVGIFEVMRISEPIRRAILNSEPATRIREIAIQEGMAPLKESAFQKILDGTTTIEEVKRAVYTGSD